MTPPDRARLQAAPPPPASSVVKSGVPIEVVALSEVFEGYSTTPYQDQKGVWTIGIGSTRDINNHPVSAYTPAITRKQAEEMAMRDLQRAANLLAQDFPEGLPPRWWAVGVLMNNNLGYMSVWGATLLRLLKAKDWNRAAEQMKEYRNTGGKPSKGLRRRRWAEAAYALGMSPAIAYETAWMTINSPDDWPKLPS